MRLLEGYIPIWGEDIQQYFQKHPREFALYYWLLANAHYKESPYQTWITGKAGKAHYSQQWKIERGDILTSKSEVNAFWGFKRGISQKKLYDFLAEKNLIEILLEEPALIIRIKNYNYMKYAGKNRKGVCQTEQGGDVPISTGGVCQTEQGGVPKRHDAIQKKPDMVPIGTQSKIHIKIQTQNEEEEGERAREGTGRENPPFFKNSNEVKSETGREIEKSIPIEESKKGPPSERDKLVIDWLSHCQEYAPNAHMSDFQISEEISRLERTWSVPKLRIILDYLKSSPTKSKVHLMFVTPKDAAKKFFNDGACIEVAYREAMFTKAKELSPKEKEEAQEKNRKFQQERAARISAEFTAKIRAMKG